jgi:hypothetical protein
MYLSLITIELALKNRTALNWSNGHDVALMIAGIGDASLTGLAAQATAALEQLWCERRGGGAERVSARNYPVIRYIRHHTDFNADASVDADIEVARSAVAALRAELVRQAVL